jgi:hypothetical protein
MDVGLLAGLLGAFANRDATRVVGGRFAEAEGGELTLVAPGSDFRLYPRIAGSPNRRRVGVHSRSGGARDAVRNRWFEIEESVAELRIRPGERPEARTMPRLDPQ